MLTNKIIKAMAKVAGEVAPNSMVHLLSDGAEATNGSMAVIITDREGLPEEEALPGFAWDTTAEGAEIALLPSSGKLRCVTVVEEPSNVGIIGCDKTGYELRACRTEEGFRYPDLHGIWPEEAPQLSIRVNPDHLVRLLKVVAAMPHVPFDLQIDYYGPNRPLRFTCEDVDCVALDALVMPRREEEAEGQ